MENGGEDGGKQERETEGLPVEAEGAAEGSGPVSQTHTEASGSETSPLTHTHSAQDSSTLPDPPPSSLHLTLANSTTALISGERDERSMMMQSEDEEEEDDDKDLIVLDPEHPLMKRFQSALEKHLTDQLKRLDHEFREKEAQEKAKRSQKESLAVELHSAQQGLAKMQAALEVRRDASAQASAWRRDAQEQLEDTRNQYSTVAEQTSKQRAEVSELQSEEDKLAQNLLYMQDVTSDLRSDITVMKNATRKAQSEKLQAEQQKQKQDLYVERLVKQEEKLKEQINLYEVQTLAQAEETQAAKDALAEAQLGMDSLAVERKQLLQQWNSSLMETNKRDEAFTAMQEALRQANLQMRALDTEAEGYKRLIVKEQEQNELLTIRLNRAQLNSATCRKLITHSSSQQEALQVMYSTCSRTLQETEKSLNRVTAEYSTCQSELAVLRKRLAEALSVRLDLEEKIMKKMQEQLTHDNAAKYSKQLSNKTASHQREREAQHSKLESELAAVTLEVNQLTLRLEALAGLQADLEKEICHRHQLLTAREAEAAKYVIAIERKQATINEYNKKIQQIVASTGLEDLSPLEIQVSNLNEQLKEVGAETKEKQRILLWQQGELVKLSQERQAQNSAVLTLHTQLTILQQKKIKIESKVKQEQRGLAELERFSKSLRLDMQKLQSLVNQNSQLSQELQQSLILTEKSFIHELKDAERESVGMQLHWEKLQEEKERLLNSLMEAERQILLWEKKIQLVRETRSTVDTEVGKGDICTMKAEIHRMELRYGKLSKQKEQLMREMEAAVARRESIVVRIEAQGRSDRKQPTHSSLHHTLQGLRRSILHTHKQAEECDGVIPELQYEKNSLIESLREKQLHISAIHNTCTSLSTKLQDLQETREGNLTRLLALQSRAKHLQAVKEGRYSATASGEAALEQAMQKQHERLHSVSGILRRAMQDFPQQRSTLQKIHLVLSSRRQREDSSST
ncbi:coiled-coil domain-containing protein 40 [Astyanax mexicanus]|uniref:coiled-coil domain-containing protein 40 n=1 Tax=Astyanax mexicanus TaxID=7994 RepID=UPI0020CAC5F1|nr:coiled-coil domain-containing protein 40 [Astyanax mexicanus]